MENVISHINQEIVTQFQQYAFAAVAVIVGIAFFNYGVRLIQKLISSDSIYYYSPEIRSIPNNPIAPGLSSPYERSAKIGAATSKSQRRNIYLRHFKHR